MSDYIERQKAIDAVNHALDRETILFSFVRKVAISALKKIAPADVVQVVHGKWTHKPDVHGVVYCSECDYELHINATSFCPNCGAKMDGERKE